MGSEDINNTGTQDPGEKRASSLADMLKPTISRPTDPRALNVPDPTPPPQRNLTDEVTSMFQRSQVDASNPPAPPAPAPVEKPAVKVDLLVCPKCNAKLSSLDNKMNQCFRCRVRLVDDDYLQQSRGPVSIGI